MNLILPAASLARPAVIQDLQAFNRLFAETYFRVVAEPSGATTCIIFTWAAASRRARRNRWLRAQNTVTS
jgi:hypothetical protein